MSELRFSRRQLLVTTGTVALAGLINADSTAAMVTDKRTLTFVDGSLSEPERLIAARTLAPHQPIAMKPDLVWQWRGELQQQIAAGARVIAITRWDKALLLRELARESALAFQQQRISQALFRSEVDHTVMSLALDSAAFE